MGLAAALVATMAAMKGAPRRAVHGFHFLSGAVHLTGLLVSLTWSCMVMLCTCTHARGDEGGRVGWDMNAPFRAHVSTV